MQNRKLRAALDAALDLRDKEVSRHAMAHAIDEHGGEWDFVSPSERIAVVESSGAWWLVSVDAYNVTVTRHATEESARAELEDIT